MNSDFEQTKKESSSFSSEHWIAVYTKPRHEKTAYKQLGIKGFTVFLPLLRERRKWSDRKKWVEFPLFKSYIFVKTELKNGLFILQTSGVSSLVKLGGNISVISDKDIFVIREMLEGGFNPEGIDYFIEGDKVEIIGGPLRGIQGVVAQIKGQDQFILKIDAIQHAVSCQIERKYIKPLKCKNANTVL